MTDSMKCPFCNADLIVHTDEQMAVCRNPNCKSEIIGNIHEKKDEK